MSEENIAAEEESGKLAEEPVELLGEERIKQQIKPLSENGFVRFFQKIWRGYLTAWHSFADKHPKAAKWIYMLAFFILFSQAVTVFQFLVFYLGPAMTPGLSGSNWGWPNILMGTSSVNGENVYFRILGAAPRFNEDGSLIERVGAGGLSYFIWFMVGTFLAQCINFPLQRNITFRSKGNVWYQLMWYFIGWVLIQPATMALGSAWEGLVAIHLGAWPGIVITLLNTLIMGGVSMAIFFCIFLVIFPDFNKVAKSLRKKVDAMKAAGVSGIKLEMAEKKLADAEVKAKFSVTDKAARKASAQASAKAMSYFKTVKDAEKATAAAASAQGAKQEKAAAKQTKLQDLIPVRLENVSKMVAVKDKAAAEFAEAKAEYDAHFGLNNGGEEKAAA
ncbi:MAG: hypothetical protein FWH03_03415 [Firmicutes bacterium]|nr:hypothetical protein [Bacillota bacterium]